MSRRLSFLFLAVALLGAARASHAQSIAVLTLDSLSFISFQDTVVLPLPSASTIKFRLGAPLADGSIPFTIQPNELEIGVIPLPDGSGSLEYGLGGPASGRISPMSGEHEIQFTASVTATMKQGDAHSGAYTYQMPFTTETATATDILGQVSVERTGVRLVDGVWYAQIVAATTNRENAVPAPGAAVYSVLSGSFDDLPIGQ